MASVIRYNQSKEDMVGDNVFIVSRPNILGNPYTHLNKKTKAQIKVESREVAVELYDKYFDAMIQEKNDSGELFRKEFDKIYEAYKTYDVIYLGCWCNDDECCHADIIRKKLLKRSMQEKLDKILKKKKKSTPKERIVD